MVTNKKTQVKDTSYFKLPHSIEAEKAVIGMLIMESAAINEVAPMLNSEMFYESKHGYIYDAIISISNNGEKVDMLNVTRELIKCGKIDEIGGPYYISELAQGVGSSVNIISHSLYINQLFLARKLAIVGQMITAKAIDQSNDIDDVISESLKEVESVAAGTCYNVNLIELNRSARNAIDRYIEREKRVQKGEKLGVPTGLNKLDDYTGGWAAQQLIILAARPAMGKSAFMIHMAKAAANHGVPVVIFTLEMSSDSITDRIMVSEMSLKSDRFKKGRLADFEKPIMCNAVDRLSALPISIDETATISIQQIKARAKNLQRKGKCGIVFIDYLQLIDMRAKNSSYNRENEVSQTSRSAKQLAKELNIPVVLLSQLSRNVESRTDKTPLLSDLRESGAIEQDADIVLFLNRPEYYDDDEEKGAGILRVAKQREGETGDIMFKYNETITRFADYDDVNGLEMPF